MDNKCFQPDLDIEMASMRSADNMPVEKEKKCVNFEEHLPTKMDNPGIELDKEMDIKMACSKNATEIPVVKKKKWVRFEEDLPTKIKNNGVDTDIKTATAIPVGKKKKRVHFEKNVPSKMDNKCSGPDLDIEMASMRSADKMPVEKEKKCVNFEEHLPTKVVCSDSVENDIPELITIQTIKNDIKPSSGPCQPDLCEETNKNVQQMKSKSMSFDPLLKVKLIVFFCTGVSLLFWSIIHFTFIQ